MESTVFMIKLRSQLALVKPSSLAIFFIRLLSLRLTHTISCVLSFLFPINPPGLLHSNCY